MAEATPDILATKEGDERRFLGRRFSSAQILIAVILTLGLLLTLNFSGRIQLDRELQGIHAEVLAEIADLQIEQQSLVEELKYVKSDAYVEYWARDDGKMIREGEILIIPQGIGTSDAPPSAVVQLVEFVTTEPEPENWELWWALFFDGGPPQLN
ncbi:MAG: hypothetical protein OXG60_02540 [Chloroflexi bacterium]|nr:hypothetical protein [Chloroflexota bacterium]